jgi:hypothetical protein
MGTDSRHQTQVAGLGAILGDPLGAGSPRATRPVS